MKKILTTLGILLLVALMALPVLAHRRGGSGYHDDSGPGGCWQGKSPNDNLTESQIAELEKLEKKYFGDTVKLREEIWAKSAELDNLLNESEPDPNKARALQKEISDIKAKMAENKLNFRLEARKVAPNAYFGRGYARRHGSGYHGGPCGQHGSYGHRGPHGGSGCGRCCQK